MPSFIHPLPDLQEPFRVSDMRPVAEAEQGGIQFRVAASNPNDTAGKPESEAEARDQHYIKLHVYGSTERIGQPPCPYNQGVQGYLRAGRPDMREVQVEQQMVQVRLVRTERRFVVKHPHGHHLTVSNTGTASTDKLNATSPKSPGTVL